MRKGFTLIELLIVLGVLVALSLAGILSMPVFRSKQALLSVTEEVVEALRNTQSRSIAEEGGMRWGVRITNSVSDDQYEIFHGASYMPSEVEKVSPLRSGVGFSEPSVSNVYDIIFSPRTGKISETKIISLISNKNDGRVGDIILKSRGLLVSRVYEGILGYWHFDEGSGVSAYDASGFESTGALTASWQSSTLCKAGGCLSFDGSDDAVDAGSANILDVEKSITLGAWIKLNSYTSGGGATDRASIIQKTGEYYMTINSSNGLLDAYFGGVTASHESSNTPVPLGVWSYIAVTYDGVSIKWYINGVLDKVSPFGGDITKDSRSVKIGGEPGFGRFTNGLIDEPRIWNRALSEVEILNIYKDLE